jgi:hypothetical protein
MSEITDLIQSYRECARHVWNCHFHDLPDGWHEFINVEYELLYGIVLAQSDELKDWRAERSEYECYPSIRVVPELGPKGTEGMWARERKNTWDWELVQITETEIGLAFIGFFDWRESGYQDYQYIRCRILKSTELPQLVGADLLLPALGVTVHYGRRTESVDAPDG